MFAWFRFVSFSFEDVDFQIVFEGRNNGQHYMPVTSSMTVAQLKYKIWANLHESLEGDKPILEKQFMDEHHLRIRGGGMMDNLEKTLKEYNITAGMVIKQQVGLPSGGTFRSVHFVSFLFVLKSLLM